MRNEGGCCLLFIVSGRDRPSMASSSPSNSEQFCCVLASPPPRPVDCYIPPTASTSRLSIETFREGPGPFVSLASPPEHILCWREAPTHHRPIFMLPRRLFYQPHGKINGLDRFVGKGRHQRWCWMALVAIARLFGDHRTWFRWSIDELIVVCCAWKSTVPGTYSHKKIKVGAAHFF